MEKFELKEEHLKLLEHLIIDKEGKVPAANWKRPFGNSNIIGDVMEILGWEPDTPDSDDPFDEDYTEDQYEAGEKLYKETFIALQICLLHREFKTGTFVKTSPYEDRSWRKIIDGNIITFDGDV